MRVRAVRAARAHLNETVDRLVREFELGYLKLDYNIEIGPGTDQGADSAGDGLLGHNRAYVAWIDEVLERHPGLVIESCASGGMRTDHAMLAVAQLHSITDQTDFRLLPAITAAAPMAVTPEQGAVWTYPVPEMTDRETAFNLAGALLGRVHLSGRLDLLRPSQEALVREALAAYRGLRRDLPATRPHWPLGLPAWRDGWIALALEVDTGRGEAAGYVLVWRRAAEPCQRQGGAGIEAQILFPASTSEEGEATVTWHQHTNVLDVALPRWSAVLVRLARR